MSDVDRPFVKAARGRKLLLGVVHLKPLPGSPRYAGGGLPGIARAARLDADRILEAGFDGYLLENFGDLPFFQGPVPSHVIAAMTRIVLELPRERVLAGVNVLRNDASGALAVAAACGLDMIRVNVHTGATVTDQGIIEGRAAATTRERALLAPGVAILADVDVKHAAPLGRELDIADAAREVAWRGLADALIVTGKATGSAASPADVRAVREAVPGTAVLVGSGVTAATIREALGVADGVIVGTWIKVSGRVEEPIDPARARELVEEARR
jgi:membrane complex biogenesis BtpA family protein